MGPLMVCFNCGNSLYIESLILIAMKLEYLKDKNITEINSDEHNNLLGTKVFEMFERYKLRQCCRNDICTYNDFSQLVYITKLNAIDIK